MGGATVITMKEARAWMVELGRHVRACREFLGWSQEALAEAAGVGQPAVSRLERGASPGAPYLVVLAIHRAVIAGLTGVAERLPEAAALLRAHPSFSPLEAAPAAVPELGDVELLEYFELYRRATPTGRSALLRIARASLGTVAPERTAVGAPCGT